MKSIPGPFFSLFEYLTSRSSEPRTASKRILPFVSSLTFPRIINLNINIEKELTRLISRTMNNETVNSQCSKLSSNSGRPPTRTTTNYSAPNRQLVETLEKHRQWTYVMNDDESSVRSMRDSNVSSGGLTIVMPRRNSALSSTNSVRSMRSGASAGGTSTKSKVSLSRGYGWRSGQYISDDSMVTSGERKQSIRFQEDYSLQGQQQRRIPPNKEEAAFFNQLKAESSDDRRQSLYRKLIRNNQNFVKKKQLSSSGFSIGSRRKSMDLSPIVVNGNDLGIRELADVPVLPFTDGSASVSRIGNRHVSWDHSCLDDKDSHGSDEQESDVGSTSSTLITEKTNIHPWCTWLTQGESFDSDSVDDREQSTNPRDGRDVSEDNRGDSNHQNVHGVSSDQTCKLSRGSTKSSRIRDHSQIRITPFDALSDLMDTTTSFLISPLYTIFPYEEPYRNYRRDRPIRRYQIDATSVDASLVSSPIGINW